MITANGGCEEIKWRGSIWKRYNIVLDLRDIRVLVLCYNGTTDRRLDPVRVSKMRIYFCVYYDTLASIAKQIAVFLKV